MQKISDLIIEHKWSLAAFLALFLMFGIVLRAWFDRYKGNVVFLNWALGLLAVALILAFIWVVVEIPSQTSKLEMPTDGAPIVANPNGDEASQPKSPTPPPTSPQPKPKGKAPDTPDPSPGIAPEPEIVQPRPAKRLPADQTIWLNAGTLNSVGRFSANRGVPLTDSTSISEIKDAVSTDQNVITLAGAEVDIRSCPPGESPTTGCLKTEGGKFKFNGQVEPPHKSGRSVWIGLTRVQ